MSRDLRPVYAVPSEAAARERFAEFDAKWGELYPAITKLWENAWSEFIPFLDYDVEIRLAVHSIKCLCRGIQQEPLDSSSDARALRHDPPSGARRRTRGRACRAR
jgi:Transposase, Mutator family